MLGLVLIYFLGKWHYTLAEQHNKQKWLFAVLGVLTYYVGTFIGGITIGVLDGILGSGSILNGPSIVLSLIAIPFGIAATWGLREILKRTWEKEVSANVTILDDELDQI